MQDIDNIKKKRKEKQNPLYKTMGLEELTSVNIQNTQGSVEDSGMGAAAQNTWQVIKVVDTKESHNICWQHRDKYNTPSDCNHPKMSLHALTPKLIVKKNA